MIERAYNITVPAERLAEYLDWFQQTLDIKLDDTTRWSCRAGDGTSPSTVYIFDSTTQPNKPGEETIIASASPLPVFFALDPETALKDFVKRGGRQQPRTDDTKGTATILLMGGEKALLVRKEMRFVPREVLEEE